MRSVDIRKALIDLGYTVNIEPHDRTSVLSVFRDGEIVEVLRMEEGEIYHENGGHIQPAFEVPDLTDAEDVAEVIHQQIIGAEKMRESRKARRSA